MADGALHGIRVLEITQVIAGPYSGLLLADLGAEVVKIEPLAGDGNRRGGSVVPGTAKSFQWLHRGKKSLVLDIESEAGKEALYRIIPHFDALITNYRVGYATHFGFDYETLSKIHPGLIYARISAFGQEGPLADAPGIELPVQAYSGIMAEEGRVDNYGAPRSSGSTWFVDIITGTSTALAVVSAVLHKRATGEGQLLDMVLLRSAMAAIGTFVMQEPLADAVIVGAAVENARQRFRQGDKYADIVHDYYADTHSQTNIPRPYFSGYTVKDGGIFLGTVTPRHRAAARKIVGVEGDIENDDIFDATNAEDVARANEVKDAVVEKMLTRTMDEWLKDFRAAGIPVAPVLFPPELADDPHAARFMIELDDPMTGPQKQLRSVFDMSKTPVIAGGPAPTLGQHTEEILAAAGLSSAEIASLRATGATR